MPRGTINYAYVRNKQILDIGLLAIDTLPKGDPGF